MSDKKSQKKIKMQKQKNISNQILRMVGLTLLVVVLGIGCAATKLEPQRAESDEWLVLESGKCMSDLNGTIEYKECRKGDVCMTRKEFNHLMDLFFATCDKR